MKKLYDIENFSEAVENNYNFTKGEEPISFFIKGLDEKQYSLYRGEPNVILARSGVGKSTMMLNISAKNVANTDNKFLIISQEMSKQALIRRTLAIIDDSYESKWREYKIKDELEFGVRKQEALKIAQELDNRVFISSETYTLSKLVKVVKQAVEDGIDGIFVDYFQLVENDLGGSFSEAQQLKGVSQEITKAIKGSKTMFCWLSQVIKVDDVRNDRIKGTSQVDNDASSILNIFVDEEQDNTMRMIVKKDRHNGNSGLEVEVGFDKGKQRIGEFAKGRLQNQSISREKSIQGVLHKPIKEAFKPTNDYTDDELPF